VNGLVLSSGKYDLIITPPTMNSAGMLGFTPDGDFLHDPNSLGAFVTNPISYQRRFPANPTRFEQYPGGSLLHTGLPNPGLRSALRNNTAVWLGHTKPVILHLLVNNPHEMRSIVEELEGIEHPVQALEIGLHRDTSLQFTDAILSHATQSQLPLMVRVSPDASDEKLRVISQSGANAVVLGPPRGLLTSSDGERVSGRLYGPGLRPFANHHMERFLKLVDIPLIMGCGLFTHTDIKNALSEGAAAVQLDTLLWLNPTRELAQLE
jgi:dihydroorotate dehydrogenase